MGEASAKSLRTPRLWTLEVQASAPFALSLRGEGLRVAADSKEVFLDGLMDGHKLLSVGAGEVIVRSPCGQVAPVYARRIGNVLRLSNKASPLMVEGETLTIDRFVFAQNLSGIPYPQRNFLKDIRLLEASALYAWRGGELTRTGTAVAGGAPGGNADEALEMILAQWEPLFATGRPVAVLLSGGYDSRLNYAMASYLARKHGNALYAFHEYKDEAECAIVRAVAEKAKIPLTVKTRKDFIGAAPSVFLDEDAIDFQSGFYRENLIRWHGYLAWIEAQHPGCFVMGLGAEAHKGKYYRQVLSVEKDSERTFGIRPAMARSIARGVGFPLASADSQTRFFDTLIEESRAFPDLAGQVDFIHYQTYISNGYGQRCHDLAQYFGLTFPFLTDDFLRYVFAMPREAKQDFAIVKRGIAKLAPEMGGLPFTSGNAKALKAREESVADRAKAALLALFGPAYFNLFPPPARGRLGLSPAEREALQALAGRSEIVSRLKAVAAKGSERIPFVRADFLLQALFFLDVCERKARVSFQMD